MNSIVTERQECVCFLYGWSQRYVKSVCVCVCVHVCVCVCVFVCVTPLCFPVIFLQLPFAPSSDFCTFTLRALHVRHISIYDLVSTHSHFLVSFLTLVQSLLFFLPSYLNDIMVCEKQCCQSSVCRDAVLRG